MKKITLILTLVYFGLPILGLSQNLLEEDFRKVSVEKIKDTLANNLPEFSDSEKETLSKKVILSQRIDLIIALLTESSIQSFLAENIIELPEDDFKASIIAGSLKENDLWIERQKINKGDQMTMMISLCESTLRHYFPDDPVDWSEFSNINARKVLANNLIKVLNGEKVDKRNKNIYPSLPSHEPSLENDSSFEEGWSEGEKVGKEERPRKYLRENSLNERRKQEFTDSPNQKGESQDEVAKKSSNLLWIITGALLIGILALLLKTFKSKS